MSGVQALGKAPYEPGGGASSSARTEPRPTRASPYEIGNTVGVAQRRRLIGAGYRLEAYATFPILILQFLNSCNS
jgi:hypothetical protein